MLRVKKNFIVKDLYKTLGFKKLKKYNNEIKWEFRITKKYTKKNKVIKTTNERQKKRNFKKNTAYIL